MKVLKNIHSKFLSLAGSCHDLPLYCFRCILGYTFLQTGWGKINNIQGVIQFFTELGIPAPSIQAPFVAGLELVGGAMILLGFLTRYISIPLSFTMIVAIVTAKKQDIDNLSDLFSTSEFLFILCFLTLIIYGPGRYSLDVLLSKWKKYNF